MIAVINDQSYVLNNYYTETSGRLHLFINCEDNPCDINTLEENILTNEGISLYAENNEDNTAELIANLSGYNKLVHLEKKYDNGTQIYVIIDVESVSELIENLQQELEAAQANIRTLMPQVNGLSSQVAQAVQNLDNAVMAFNEKDPIIQENSTRVAQMLLDIEFLQSQNTELLDRVRELELAMPLPESDILSPSEGTGEDDKPVVEEEPSEQE